MIIHRSRYLQTGRGIGGIFASIFKSLVPMVKSLGRSVVSSPITKNALKAAKEAGTSAALNLASDAIAGNDMRDSLNRNLKDARQSIGMSLQQPEKSKSKSAKSTKRGSKGRKRTKVKQLGVTAKRGRYRDIFD